MISTVLNVLVPQAISPERVRGLVLINLVPGSVPWLSLSQLVGKVISYQLHTTSISIVLVLC